MKNIISHQEMRNIEDLCTEFKIYNYTINPDGSLDVNGTVNIIRRKESFGQLALSFNKVSGDFVCNQNKLTTLKGCPVEVGGNFSCGLNELTSLEYAPQIVGGSFLCYGNSIESLMYCPKEINGSFKCDNNNLTSLEFGPVKVTGSYNCDMNYLNTLYGAPGYVGSKFYCQGNNLTSMEFCPAIIKQEINCCDNNLTSLEGIPNVKYIQFRGNKFGKSFDEYYGKLNVNQILVFHKYYQYYDIWIDGVYQEDNMISLVDEIIDGLA